MCFFFNDTATTEIYTLSLHDALPIFDQQCARARLLDRRQVLARHVLDQRQLERLGVVLRAHERRHAAEDRKSTRLNSSHANISYAVFCLKKKTDTSQRCASRLVLLRR